MLERNAVGAAAPLCDANKVQGVRSRRKLGGVLILAGIGGAIVGSSARESAGLVYSFVSVSTLAGYYMRYVRTGYDEILLSTVNAVQVGKTTRGEIVNCLGSPRATTSGRSGDVATWVAANSGLWFISGSARTASITFRADVASNVERSDWR